MFFLSFGQKSENPRLSWQSRVFENSLNQEFIPTTPKRRESRWQMAFQPFIGACCISLTNVAFISVNRTQETPFDRLCQFFLNIKNYCRICM